MKKLFTLFLSLVSVANVMAQGNWCATDEEHQIKMATDKAYAESRIDFEKQVDHWIAQGDDFNKNTTGPLIIPLVVHIIHDGAKGNISKEQVLDGIRVLNEDYLRINADTNETRSVFKPVASGVDIQFRLAQIDPNGNCTEGIVRVDNAEMSNGPSNRNAVKSISHWPENKYFNVWVVNSIVDNDSDPSTIILGFGEFPSNNLTPTYGFVNLHEAWGQIGTARYGGRTPTHEIGHCLNLYHTFQSGCGSSCTSSGDRVCDTPPSTTATYGCNTSQNTCSNDDIGGSPFGGDVVDQIENYMSYDNCQNMFTMGQRDRMYAAINSSTALQNLVSEANLIATGTNDGYVPQNCAPIAGISISQDMICQDAFVTITDRTYNSSDYTRTWSFPGASIASSTDSIVTISYPSGGMKEITLTVTNAAGTDTFTWTNAIDVISTTPQFQDYMIEEFGGGSLPTGWSVNNPNGVGFETYASAGFEDDNCITLNNRVNPSGEIDELVLPVVSLKGTTNPTLTFYHAYAKKTTSNSDILSVYVSTNCGQSWIRRKQLSADQLATRSNKPSGTFIPAGNHEWLRAEVNLSSYRTKDYILMKVEWTSGGGNNVYLDKFILGDQVGIEEFNLGVDMTVIPNPISNEGFVRVQSENSQELDMRIIDMMGRVVYSENVSISQGESRLPINLSQQAAGVYTIQLIGESGQVTQKFMKK